LRVESVDNNDKRWTVTSGDGGTQIGRTSSTTKTAMEEEEEEKRGKI
jgi:hypothetical protein